MIFAFRVVIIGAYRYGYWLQGVKGGESSSQFRWFTIAKIEL